MSENANNAPHGEQASHKDSTPTPDTKARANTGGAFLIFIAGMAGRGRKQFQLIARVLELIFPVAVLVVTLYALSYFVIPDSITAGQVSFAEYFSRLFNLPGSFLTGLVALCALVTASHSLEQKRESDNRAAFYDRVQWSLNLTLDPDEDKQSAGWIFLPALAESTLRTHEDEDFIEALHEYIEEKKNWRSKA